ncbi:Histone deacetylase 8 [Mortierella polycephala]|uniref:Histone deacetylase 8 n=1 Tax=Mortierella polycephala TaxID=41804 RepID=A0A9P6PS74_9FUNG|nr:Histone deacetylase 8 [Mortierella polycephala]
MAHPSRRIAYIYSSDYASIASRLPSNLERSNFQLFTVVYAPQDFLKRVEQEGLSDGEDEEGDHQDGGEHRNIKEDRLEEYGLRYDCPVFEGIADYAELVAGSSMEAATLLSDDAFDMVVHWDGGRHHAKKDMAAGFCIVNDIVLGIMELQRTYERVVYLDLDVHHGDGVENAFQFTDKVLTVSVHHYAQGFYPGTGSGNPTSSRTKAAVNIPLKGGLSDTTLCKIFDDMIEPLFKSFDPEAIVLQCGVDGMAGDPLGKWNLSLQSYVDCLKKVMAWKKPLMVLGGGGYKNTSTARCYALLTSVALGREISEEIPEHEFFEDYKPDFMLQIDPGRQTDENTDDYMEQVRELVEAQTDFLESK